MCNIASKFARSDSVCERALSNRGLFLVYIASSNHEGVGIIGDSYATWDCVSGFHKKYAGI